MDGDRPDLPAAVERALRDRLGGEPDRASVAFVGVEPIDVLRFRAPGEPLCYVTVGMCRRPMGGHGARAELLLRARRDGGQLWRRLALLAAAPAVEDAVYAVGSTVDLGAPLDTGSRCTGAVVAESGLAPIAAAGTEVAVLRVLPATATELAWARVRGADALRRRWADRRVDLADLARAPVELTA